MNIDPDELLLRSQIVHLLNEELNDSGKKPSPEEIRDVLAVMARKAVLHGNEELSKALLFESTTASDEEIMSLIDPSVVSAMEGIYELTSPSDEFVSTGSENESSPREERLGENHSIEYWENSLKNSENNQKGLKPFTIVFLISIAIILIAIFKD